MLKPLLLIATAAASLSPAPAKASEEYAIAGAGTASCGVYLDEAKNETLAHMYVHWAQGFLTGMNAMGHASKQPLVLQPDAPTLQAYMTKYCKDHPLEHPLDAVTDLYFELRKRGRVEKP